MFAGYNGVTSAPLGGQTQGRSRNLLTKGFDMPHSTSENLVLPLFHPPARREIDLSQYVDRIIEGSAKGGPRPKTLRERFWQKVERADGCWKWHGATDTFGYGSIGSGRRGDPSVQAHRVSWVIHFGPIPRGLCVLHDCDNPPCCNPAHLFLGTKADNVADMIAKDRQQAYRKGAAVQTAKLSESDVSRIRADSRPARALAQEYGVYIGTVYSIRERRTWKHIP